MKRRASDGIAKGEIGLGVVICDEERLEKKRLPAGDVSTLRFLFGGLEAEAGLVSNFGAMCERIASSVLRTAPDPQDTPIPDASPLDAAGTELVEAASGIRLALADRRFGPRRRQPKRRNGVLVARGVQDPTIHVRAVHDQTRPQELTRVESWACWENHRDGSLGRRVAEAWRTLLWLADGDGRAHLVVLWLMYGSTVPASRYAEFRALGDLLPLALETDTVRAHADRLSLTLRNERAFAFRESAIVAGDRDSRRPCQCPPHTDETCPFRKEADFDGCPCWPGPHARSLCPAEPRRAEMPDEWTFRGRDALQRLDERHEWVEPLDALRDLLGVPTGEKKRADVRERALVRAQRATQIRLEAHRMLRDASEAYRDARDESAKRVARYTGNPAAWMKRKRSFAIGIDTPHMPSGPRGSGWAVFRKDGED